MLSSFYSRNIAGFDNGTLFYSITKNKYTELHQNGSWSIWNTIYHIYKMENSQNT